ncbi:MAG TPA: Xaa-Pro peptidase family protein [Bryobacteraceae bacterium]|jgi:Xaa-Pro dipeptidase|nr:Xaa-Pro peptidase family protein [Bryobacteraceae bacterium]
MATRRCFLLTAGLAPAALSAAPADSPIAQLKNRHAEAQPITTAERRTRISRAQQLMAENKIDAICLAGGTSLNYFSGARWGNSERLFMMIIPARGEAFFVCPGFEEDRAREQIAAGPVERAHVYTWQEDESPYTLAAFGLKEAGLSTGKVGIEENTPFVFANSLAKAAPAATVTSATAVTSGCRMIKSGAEIALLRLASSVTMQAYEAAWKSLRDGMTARQFGELIGSAYQALGFPGFASVQVGEYTALPHGSRQPQNIREGSIVLIDDGCTVEGYQSDISRTFVLGKATDKMKRVFEIVHRAQSAALATARPGLPCEAVDAAARKVIVDAGYGPGYKYFTHRVGHGLGMDGHEWPYLVRGDALPLAANMTFSDEPGIYIRGEFGVRLEDDMHITESGAELLSPQSPSIEQPFG